MSDRGDALPPCVYCGAEAESLATGRCKPCRQLEHAIHLRREVAQRIVAEFVFEPRTDWPTHFPGAFQHWPQTLRTAAGQLLVRYWAESLTPADLVKTIATSQFGQTALRRIAQVPPMPPFTAGATEWWPFFLLVARAQTALASTPARAD